MHFCPYFPNLSTGVTCSTRHPHIMLLSICVCRVNRFRESNTFLTGLNEIN
jgi:hypothetical protein